VRDGIAAAVIGAVLLALPMLIANAFYLGIATHVLVFALLALSLNILLGGGGMTSLGHATYLGVPAYVCAGLTAAGFGAGLAALGALAAGTVLAMAFGVLALRARVSDDHAGAGAGGLGCRVSVGRVDGGR
jgi:branched-chain amino acid transport system permease protein